jgi:hypothetical protein
MSYQEASPPEARAKRRPGKFRPERIQQIKDLLTRGETSERIAAIIWSHRGHTASDLFEAGHQFATTKS